MIRHHSPGELCSPGNLNEEPLLVPGEPVSIWSDRGSYGIIIAVRPSTVTIVWSRGGRGVDFRKHTNFVEASYVNTPAYRGRFPPVHVY